jgi:hypothetical protein
MKKIITSLFFLIICFEIKAQTVTITQLQQACNHDGKLIVTASGITPPIIYEWNVAGTIKTDTSNSFTDTLSNYSGSWAYCYIFDISGQFIASDYFSSPPFTYTATTTNAVCPVTIGSGTVSITGGHSPYNVQWLNIGTQTIISSGLTTNSLTIGQYDVEITDANGCVFGSKENTDSIWVQQASPVQITVVTTTANCTNGTASVTSVTGGLAPYTYSWNNGQTSQQITNLITGNYNIIVTDAQGCSGSQYVYIPQGVTVYDSLVVTPATCLQHNGSAISFGSGGVPPYSYIYSSGQTTQTATGLTGGNSNYNVQVTDANGCIGSNYFYINSSTPITVVYNATASSCTAPTGSASLTISGGQIPYTINWVTSPVQTGATVSNLISGIYQFNITDANGCVQSGSVYIPPVSNLSAYPYGTDPICPNNNGTAVVNAYSSYPPITYLWNTGATTYSIGNLSQGVYSCTITDALGCQHVKVIGLIPTSPIHLGFNTKPATCIFRNDGKINLTPTGGVAPYTYQWWNGPTTQNISNLATQFYTVTVTDANGCTKTDTTYLGYNATNDSCYCTVTGKVFYDVNGNCTKDVGETSIDNILIKNNNTITTYSYSINNYMFTDTAGVYRFILPTGNYNIQEVIQHMYPLSSCQSNTNPLTLTAASGCTYTVNFANSINPLHDVHIFNAHLNLPQPGQNYWQQVIVQNNGTVVENNIQFGYGHDGQLSYSGSSGITLTQPNAGLEPNWYDNTSTVPTLNPGKWVSTIITYAVPTNIPLGTIVNFWDSTSYTSPMSNWLNDYTPWNNVKAFDTVVVESFDPNFKEVSPKGVGSLGYVNSTDTVFDYIIHFQNTGSAPANKIILKDSIDSDFVIESIKPGYSNHNYVASIDNNNVLSFTFNNINLPPMSIYPIGSIGIVAYSIHAKKNLAIGTQFKNSAAIFFDYNAPIITNTTINTINNNIGIKEIKSIDNAMSLFPNPTADNYSLKITTEEETTKGVVNVYNLEGSLISENIIVLTKGANLFNYSVANFAAGMYVIRVIEGGRQHITKLSVVK